MELYCDEPDRDCRRVTVAVLRPSDGVLTRASGSVPIHHSVA
jgi:hypothetical protein